ncbi:MAG: hypothetical protein KKB37_06205, partial [Alphaproteobacteria bacterium]|nr:hypothetical protein [Alphaproteobacteria bacterium]
MNLTDGTALLIASAMAEGRRSKAHRIQGPDIVIEMTTKQQPADGLSNRTTTMNEGRHGAWL